MVSAWDVPRKLKMLLYGDTGTGKTTIWATFPKPIKAYICSGIDEPGELLSIDTPENRKSIDPEFVTDIAQLQNLPDLSKYGTVVLDHVTGVQDYIIKEYMGLDHMPIVKTRKAAKGESFGIVPQADWTEINTISIKIFREFLNLRANVVLVCQERLYKTKEEVQSDIIKPSIGGAASPQVISWLNPTCDYIVQAYKRPHMVETSTLVNGKKVAMMQRGEGVEYCLRTEPHDIYITKFRVPKGRPLPASIVDASYEKIVKVIEGRG